LTAAAACQHPGLPLESRALIHTILDATHPVHPHHLCFGEQTVNEKLANPAPLGLMGFGMTTVLLNIHNAGFMPISAMILAMGLAYGGLAQVIAGILEFKKGNTFGLTAFTSYGFFWISLVFLILLPKLGLGDAADEFAMGWYLLMWGIFTLFMNFSKIWLALMLLSPGASLHHCEN
jgi:succinate-acetate transporter protein